MTYPDPEETHWVPLGGVALGFSYGTDLPESPKGGQLAILVDSIIDSTYQWLFRYNAKASSLYKWEFIGGPPIVSICMEDEDHSVEDLWADVGNGGPVLDLPRDGDYLVSASAQMYNSAGNTMYAGIWDCAENTIAPVSMMHYQNKMMQYQSVGSIWANLAMQEQIMYGVEAGKNLKLVYKQSSEGILHAQWRIIKATPVRVL